MSGAAEARPGVRTGITRARGFTAAAVAAGIKPDRLDLAVVAADRVCAAAGVFTTNRVQAAPVRVSRAHLAQGRARAIVANAGCANAATGARGLEDARRMAACAANALGCPPSEIVVASTGVIGVHLPIDRVTAGIARAMAERSEAGGADAARAILTTDTRPKETAVEFAIAGGPAVVGAMAKGAGMIAPHMATMLAFFTTDAAIEAAPLRAALAEAVGESFNRITVDGDTSTNDMAVILASGAASAAPIRGPGRDYDAFRAALAEASRRIAEMLVRDGEGVTRIAEVRVEGAREAGDADRIARAVAESLLVKTALHGGDPNWGRVLAAVGRSGVAVDVDRVDIFLGEVWVCEGGCAREYDEARAHRALTVDDPVRILVRMREGKAAGWMWTADLSKAYVDINASYRS
jgi:glutamate N-acetyltransferase/amino-acid N-acetyltransferase